MQAWGLQYEFDINHPGNHGKNQDRITRMNEEGENGVFPAFFLRFFFPRIVHIVNLMGFGQIVNKTS